MLCISGRGSLKTPIMVEATPQIEKTFVSAEDLLQDSFELALRIHESEFRPSFILGVWRGGAPVGIAVQEVLETLDCPTNHFAIRTSSYGARTTSFDGDEVLPEVQVMGLQHVVDMVNAKDRLTKNYVQIRKFDRGIANLALKHYFGWPRSYVTLSLILNS